MLFLSTDSDTLVATVNDVVRSVASLRSVNEKELFFITVSGDSEENANIRFELKRSNEESVNAFTSFRYTSNAMIGSLSEPALINFSALRDKGLTASPNPFVNNVTFDIVADEAGTVKIEIFDIAGRMIFTDSYNSSSADSQYGWNGRTASGIECETGIYLVKVYVAEKTYLLKINKQ